MSVHSSTGTICLLDKCKQRKCNIFGQTQKFNNLTRVRTSICAVGPTKGKIYTLRHWPTFCEFSPICAGYAGRQNPRRAAKRVVLIHKHPYHLSCSFSPQIHINGCPSYRYPNPHLQTCSHWRWKHWKDHFRQTPSYWRV